MPGREDIHEEQERQARADLDRLRNPGGAGLKSGRGDSGAETDDPVEKWGRLIGRTAGVVFLVYLVYWLSTRLF